MKTIIEKLGAGHKWKTEKLCYNKSDVLNFMSGLSEISEVYLSQNFSFNKLNEILNSIEYRLNRENNHIYF